MPKIGRNDPCPCGSGKKYKQCHLPIEEAAAAEQLRLRRSVDTLLPKVIMAAQAQAGAIPAAFERFWDGKYTPAQLEELDDLEGRGGERFLTWFAFDYPLEDGRTLVEQLAAGDARLSNADPDQADHQNDTPELTDDEAQLLRGWASVRLRPYLAQSVRKGRGMQVSDLLDERIDAVTGEIEALVAADEACRRLMSVPGVGPIIASAMVATIGNGAAFQRGRDFGAWLGLVPRQISTGDRTVLGRLTKRGNSYLRSLLIQAARVLLLWPAKWRQHSFGEWLTAASMRLHHNVLAAALANKLARIAWSVLSQNRIYEPRTAAVMG